MNPDVSKHMQMNPSGFRCIQMDPDISRLIYIYIYIYPDESKWTQSIQAMEHAVSVQLQHRASYSYIAYRQIYMHDGISREAYITLRLFNAFLKAVSAMWDIKLSLIRDFLSDIAICCFFPAVKPKFKVRPLNTTAFEGYSTMLHCVATGDPLPIIQWDKNNKVNGFDPNRFKVSFYLRFNDKLQWFPNQFQYTLKLLKCYSTIV